MAFSDLTPIASYLDAHADGKAGVFDAGQLHPIVTISRQCGARGSLIAEKAVPLLTARDGGRPWIVMDGALAGKVVEEHRLPERIARFLTEEESSRIEGAVEELLGLHPSRWTLVEKMVQTILSLAQIGRVIFVGRAAHVVTANFPHSFHIRIVAPREMRVRRMMELLNLTEAEAALYVAKVDKQRKVLVRRHFSRDIDDPEEYHFLINTGRVSFDDAARLIAELVLPSSSGLPAPPGAPAC